jgi:hypothetical protein
MSGDLVRSNRLVGRRSEIDVLLGSRFGSSTRSAFGQSISSAESVCSARSSVSSAKAGSRGLGTVRSLMLMSRAEMTRAGGALRRSRRAHGNGSPSRRGVRPPRLTGVGRKLPPLRLGNQPRSYSARAALSGLYSPSFAHRFPGTKSGSWAACARDGRHG